MRQLRINKRGNFVATMSKSDSIAGRNGIVIAKRTYEGNGSGFRTYEVYQRERVGESTEKIKPNQLISDDYRINPYPALDILRENYPCYRDWLSNSFWVTQYNDVTSIFADDANFESRPRAWYYGIEDYGSKDNGINENGIDESDTQKTGRNLNHELSVLNAEASCTDNIALGLAEKLAETLASQGSCDLATEFAARFALEITAARYGIQAEDFEFFSSAYWRMQRGTSFDPALQNDGKKAMDELVTFFKPIVEARSANPGDDVVSAMVTLQIPATAIDVVATLLETDHETLHGALANLWFLLLTHPAEFEKARSEQRLMKLAYLETIRHSTPVLTIDRFARHEVERFGRLIPEGARVICSAASANRDPRVFHDPDRFIADRTDMCQREPRGQYRADGLPSGITFKLGKPSIYPAVPEDRPRSKYAQNRDLAVIASQALIAHLGDIELSKHHTPRLSSLTVGEMHTCWKLPVTYKSN
ncbi:MAG: cytochrome P450 [Candidatus Azotimanducaceae bacterium]|jgi:cytochrome P450